MSLYNKIKKWFNGDEEVKVIPRPGDTFYIDNKLKQHFYRTSLYSTSCTIVLGIGYFSSEPFKAKSYFKKNA